jgi:carboxymethylenebutenolidase
LGVFSVSSTAQSGERNPHLRIVSLTLTFYRKRVVVSRTSEVTIDSVSHALRAFVVKPDAEGPWPGVVVIHDVFGMTADLKAQAERLADDGYVAVAPDLYSYGRKLPCLVSTFRAMRHRSGPAFDDINAVKEWVSSSSDCTGKVGIIGFCMGGGFALLTASGYGFSASSVNYGQVPKDAEALLSGACPVVGSFGAKDKGLRGAAAKLEVALTHNDVPHDVKEYAQASHSFLNDHEGRLATVLMKVTGVGYEESAANDARTRIRDFFATYLT